MAAVTLLSPMVLHNVQASADNNKTSQIKETLAKNESFQEFTKLSGINIDLSKLNNDKADQIGHELSDYTNNYNKTLNSINDNEASLLKSEMESKNGKEIPNNVDAKMIIHYANQFAKLAQATQNAAKQGDKDNAQANKKKVPGIRNIFQQHRISTIDFGGQTYNITKMNDNDLISLDNQLIDFISYYKQANTEHDISRRVDYLRFYLQNFDASNLAHKNNDDLLKMGKDLNSLAVSLQNVSQGISSSDAAHHKADKIRNVLLAQKAKDIPVMERDEGGALILNPDDSNDVVNTNAIPGYLVHFANSYQYIQGSMKAEQAYQLKPLIKKFNNSDVSHKDNATVIKLGADLNEAAKDVQSDLQHADNDKNSSNDKHDNGNDSDDSKNDGGHSKDNNNDHQNDNKNDHSNGNHGSGKSDSKGSNTTNGGSTINVNPTNNNQNNHNDPNYYAPKMNDGSKNIGFPSTPSENHKPASHKTKKSKKANAKQLRTAKARIKKARKQMNKIKKQLRKTKSHAKRAKINKQLKVAKKSVAHAKVRFNHTKHNK